MRRFGEGLEYVEVDVLGRKRDGFGFILERDDLVGFVLGGREVGKLGVMNGVDDLGN